MIGINTLLHTLQLGDGVDPDLLRDRWRRLDTAGTGRLMEFEGGSLWLLRRLSQLGLLSQEGDCAIDPDFVRKLRAAARDYTLRHMLVASHIEVVARLLLEADVPFVLLKGAARLVAPDLYPYSEARTTNDIDVLIPERAANEMEMFFKNAGYDYQFPPEKTPLDHYHVRPLISGAGVPVELHLSTSEAVTPAEAWRRTTSAAITATHEGYQVMIPSATELLWHGITHAVFHGSGAFRLRYYLDASSILASGTALDWEIIDSRLGSAEVPGRRRTVAWLGAAAWLAGTTLPAEVSRGVVPFRIDRVMRWRLGVLGRSWIGPRMTEKLLDEGTRVEAGMGLTPSVIGRPVLIRSRRRSAAAAARAGYLAWRLGQR
jgi:hypothetical protein